MAELTLATNTAALIAEVRGLLAVAPDYLIPHMPQPDNSALLCDGDDNSVGEVYDTPARDALVKMLAGLPQTLTVLCDALEQSEARVERLERVLAAERDMDGYVEGWVDGYSTGHEAARRLEPAPECLLTAAIAAEQALRGDE